MTTDLRRSRWAVSFAFWSIPALFLTTLSLRESSSGSIIRALAYAALPWYYWALVTPSILHLARRVSFDALRERRGLLIHAGAALAYGFGEGIFSGILILAVRPESLPEGAPIEQLLVNTLVFWTIFGLLFYSMIASVGFVLGFQEKLREREVAASRLEARLVEAQLGALRMQLQPHFLFNTLNTIAMHVREGDAQTSTRLIARLSEMLRHLLDDDGAQEVPLAVELGHTRRYLDIEQARFSDRLTILIDVACDLDDAMVPSLVLQPLVENAIRHAIATRAAAGTIEIVARRDHDDLRITIRNEGPRLPVDFRVDAADGIGLRNTLLRLQHLYAARGTLTLQNLDDGVIATVTLPYHTTPVLAYHG